MRKVWRLLVIAVVGIATFVRTPSLAGAETQFEWQVGEYVTQSPGIGPCQGGNHFVGYRSWDPDGGWWLRTPYPIETTQLNGVTHIINRQNSFHTVAVWHNCSGSHFTEVLRVGERAYRTQRCTVWVGPPTCGSWGQWTAYK
jgi:hypothetical protein